MAQTILSAILFGSQSYFQLLHLSLMPQGWFPPPALPGQTTIGTAAVEPALTQGGALASAWSYGFLEYVHNQSRVASASGEFLDLASFDYFGTRLPRLPGESDLNYAPRIQQELIRPRNTRAALILAIQDIAGVTPIIIEPWNPNDTGGWGVYQRLGYGVAGYWGSYRMPFQTLVIVPQFNQVTGSSGFSAWGAVQGGYGKIGTASGRLAWGNISLITGEVTDAVVLQAIENVREANTVIWVQEQNTLPTTGFLNDNGVLTLTGTTPGYPLTSAGLVAGNLYSNGRVVSIVPGATPNPAAAPVYFTDITVAQLAALGGGNLPHTQQTLGSMILWNNGGVVSIS